MTCWVHKLYELANKPTVLFGKESFVVCQHCADITLRGSVRRSAGEGDQAFRVQSSQTIWPGNQLDAFVVLPIIGGKQERTMARKMDSLYQNVV